MTQCELTIDRAAREGVCSSLDAHGVCVPAADVWTFLRDSDFFDFGAELPESMPPMFVERYEFHQNEMGLSAGERSN